MNRNGNVMEYHVIKWEYHVLPFGYFIHTYIFIYVYIHIYGKFMKIIRK